MDGISFLILQRLFKAKLATDGHPNDACLVPLSVKRGVAMDFYRSYDFSPHILNDLASIFRIVARSASGSSFIQPPLQVREV